MSRKYVVQHVGRIVCGSAIEEDEWKKLSEHKTESAAWKRITKETEHLQWGWWDDHYRVLMIENGKMTRIYK